jgi:hypothetical protein
MLGTGYRRTEFVLRIAFLLQQGLHECTRMLHYSTLPVLYNDVTVLMLPCKGKQPGYHATVCEELFVTLCKGFS